MKNYNYRVVWSEKDQEYVGLCDEFKSLSHLSKSPKEALDGIIDLVEFIKVELPEQVEIEHKSKDKCDFSGSQRFCCVYHTRTRALREDITECDAVCFGKVSEDSLKCSDCSFEYTEEYSKQLEYMCNRSIDGK